MIAMDVLELPLTIRGNRYVLVVSDYFTRWPECFALKDQRATTVAQTLVDGVISRHGVPSVLHSDQGPNFESFVIKEMCRKLGISKTRTTPYHPQCDGLVERLNRILLQILSKYCGSNPTDWDIWLPVVVGAYRSAKQSSTGYSPFEMVYGRKARLPIDEFLDNQLPEPQDPDSYVAKLQRHHQIAKETVEASLTAAQARQKRNYDTRTTNPYKYNQGDTVWLFTRPVGKNRKSGSPWTGPFKIVQARGSTGYVIQPINGGRKRRVHYNRLKPYYRRPTLAKSASGFGDPDTSQNRSRTSDTSHATVRLPPPTFTVPDSIPTGCNKEEESVISATPTAPTVEDVASPEKVGPSSPPEEITVEGTTPPKDLGPHLAELGPPTPTEDAAQLQNQRPRRNIQSPARFEDFVTDWGEQLEGGVV